jgi:rhamnosyltransferase
MQAPSTQVSVVIPTHNAGIRFEQTLAALAAQDMPVPYEIVVIDSGSHDGTLERCAAHGVRVLTVSPAQFGHGRTRNQAIATCHGLYVALTVQDAVPTDAHWLARLVSALDDNPQAAGAYARCLPHPDAGLIARWMVEHGYQSMYPEGRVEQRIANRTVFESLSREAKRQVCAFDNVGSLIRRAVWQRFPFRDVNYAEDLAWGYDVLGAGYTLIYEPSASIYHSHERSLGYELRRAYVDRQALARLLGDARPHPVAEQPSRAISPWSPVQNVAGQLIDTARQEGSLTPSLRATIWLYALAVTIGGALGDLNRPAQNRLGRMVDRWLAHGV